MSDSPTRREVLAAGIGLSLSGLALAQPNVRDVKPLANAEDRGVYKEFPDVPNDNFYVLDFRFKDVRFIKVNVPARGVKVCWYLWYQVINKTNKPRTFSPTFELVTRDLNTKHRDQFLPYVLEKIREVEDPTNYYKIKNSASISNDPIPPSLKENALPRTVTGVAIWDDVNPETKFFDIFITGLSNGFTLTDPIPPDTKQVLRLKTLQLAFKRTGGEFKALSSQIEFQSPATWIYRGTTLKVPG